MTRIAINRCAVLTARLAVAQILVPTTLVATVDVGNTPVAIVCHCSAVVTVQAFIRRFLAHASSGSAGEACQGKR